MHPIKKHKQRKVNASKPKSKAKVNDANAPSPWNVRIWDEDNQEWLGQSNPGILTYYGFDIRGGEVATVQGMAWVYNESSRGRKLIWERSTGLVDRDDIEIYEGDIVSCMSGERGTVEYHGAAFFIVEDDSALIDKTPMNGWDKSFFRDIGNIHENGDLLEGEDT